MGISGAYSWAWFKILLAHLFKAHEAHFGFQNPRSSSRPSLPSAARLPKTLPSPSFDSFLPLRFIYFHPFRSRRPPIAACSCRSFIEPLNWKRWSNFTSGSCKFVVLLVSELVDWFVTCRCLPVFLFRGFEFFGRIQPRSRSTLKMPKSKRNRPGSFFLREHKFRYMNKKIDCLLWSNWFHLNMKCIYS